MLLTQLKRIVLTITLLAPLTFSSAAFAWGGYTSIVFLVDGQHLNWGSYHGASAREDAETGAQGFCGTPCASYSLPDIQKETGNIHETWAYNGWVALARGNNTTWGVSDNHDSQDAAEQSAISNCGGQANACKIIRSVSSYDDQDDIDGVRPSK